jgi:hypothetical protein
MTTQYYTDYTHKHTHVMSTFSTLLLSTFQAQYYWDVLSLKLDLL